MGKTPYTAGEKIAARPAKSTPGTSIRPSFIRAAEPALQALADLKREVADLDEALAKMGGFPQMGDLSDFADLALDDEKS